MPHAARGKSQITCIAKYTGCVATEHHSVHCYTYIYDMCSRVLVMSASKCCTYPSVVLQCTGKGRSLAVCSALHDLSHVPTVAGYGLTQELPALVFVLCTARRRRCCCCCCLLWLLLVVVFRVPPRTSSQYPALEKSVRLGLPFYGCRSLSFFLLCTVPHDACSDVRIGCRML